MSKKLLPLVCLLMLVSLISVSAYIDPGTGSYIVSGIGPAIWAALLGLFGVIAAFFRRTIIDRARENKKATIIILVLVLIIIYLVFFTGCECDIKQTGGLTDSKTTLENPVKKTETTSTSKDETQDTTQLFDPSLSGAHMYDVNKSFDGYNLYEGKLIDMEGNIVHQWDNIYLGILDDEGNYYAQEYYEAPTFGKYTWGGDVIWERDIPIHHHILLDGDKLYTFTKEVHIYNGRDVEFDVILELNATTGEDISRYSIWDHLSEFQQFHKSLELDQPGVYEIPEEHQLNESIWGGHYDYYHLNYLDILPENALSGQYDTFQKGNWLISFRHGSMLFILDKDTKKIKWRAIYDQVDDNLEGQHSPKMLEDGNILVFDNGRYRKWSRVIELDPLTLDIVWEFKAPWFYTLSQGDAQRLPNGNTLVTEAEDGHVFEITPDGEMVWEFYNPDKQGPENSNDKEKWGKRQEIYKMERYPKDFIEQFL